MKPTTVIWTKEKFEAFKEVYNRATLNSTETFSFNGVFFQIDYAKYLIQHLETQFSA
jgi:hypothetical protein